MDRIKEMVDQLSELSDEQLGELQSAIVTEFETVEGEEPTPQTVDAMTSLADMLDTVRGEVRQREAQSVELASKATDAASRVYGEEAQTATEDADPMMEAPMMEAPMMEDAPAPAPADEETPEEEVAAEEEDEDAEKMPVMASSDVAEEISASTETAEEAELSTEDLTETSEETETAFSDNTPDAPVAQEEIVEATVTAAAQPEEVTPEVPADRRPVTSGISAVPVAITAGADIPGVTAGSSFDGMSDVAEAFAKRLHGLRRVNGGDGEQHIVASLSTQYPDARQLGSDAEENWAKIQEVAGPAAITASGGFVAPLQTRYDVFGIGTNDRPVRDSLARFQADRGGIRFIVPPVLNDYGSAVGVWTTTLDTAYGSGTSVSSATKDSLVVAAASETTATADAVTLQMQFGNLSTRAYPELIARHNELGLIQHAREAEQNLLSKIATASTAVTSTSVLGFAADFLLQVGRAASNYRLYHRMDPNAALRVIAPIWVKAAIRADLALQMPGDGQMAATDGEIENLLKVRGINVTWTLDRGTGTSTPAAQGSGAMNEFGDTFVWFLFAEGTFLFLDGGTLDLGIIRDSTLVGTNDYKMFVETFEGLAKVGVESVAVTSTIQVNGARAALRDTLGATTATTIEF